MIYAFEDFTIDTDRFQLARSDELIEAEPQVLEFLIHLVQHQGQLLSKDALHRTIWPDRVVSDAALSTLVRNARRLVGDSGEEQRIIATRHGRGFVFRADVREVEETQPGGKPASGGSSTTAPRVQGAPAIMVLPFQIVGEPSDAQGLSEGITEEVMAALAKSRWFPLIARNRVKTFLELSPEARHPYKGFGATYIVEGGVFRDGDNIRLHLQLTDTEPALHIHVSRHELKYAGLFRLLDDISTCVAAIAQPELIEAERVKAAATDPESRCAWQEFVLGQHLLAAPDKDANATARAHFERALSMEPGSGRIHAGLAMTHLWDYQYHWSQSAELSLGAAARDAERALALAPDDSWAWSILAICKLSLRRFKAALADAQRAIDVDPASAMAHGCQSWVLAYSGHYEDALAAFDRAMLLGPNDRRRVLWLIGRETAQFGLGDFEGALDTARELISLSPGNPSGYRVKCAALASLGRLVDARRAANKLVELLPDHDVDEAVARQPFQPDLAAHYAGALKKAGLRGSGDMSKGPKPPHTTGTQAPYPINYTTTKDGVRIAWSRMGSGPPLVASVRWLGNLALDHENPLCADIVRRLAERFTLVQFDHRGIGQSQRDIEGLTRADLAADLEAVVDAAGLDQFALFTMSHGCMVAYEYQAWNPDRLTRTALFGSSRLGWRHPERGEPTDQTEAIMAIARLGWDAEEPTFRRLTIQSVLPETSRIDTAWLDDYLRQTINARMSVQIIEALADYDYRDVLGQMKAPALVLHAKGDLAVPVVNARHIAEAIPDATFIETPTRNNAFSQIDAGWEQTLETVMAFLAEKTD